MPLPRLLVLAALLALAGCRGVEPPVVVGAKDFPEQRIAAQMVVQSLRAQDIPAEVDDVPRDTLGAIGALWLGDIDVYVEYTGSGLALVGHPPVRDPAASLAAARERFAPFGLVWGEPLGFRNDYVVLARPGSDLAGAELSALADRRGLLRIGMTRDFRERPRDGFEALARRYGLRAEPALVVPSGPEGKARLYRALLDGDVDLAVGFLTDPEIAEFGLARVRDDRGFFPAYAAAPLTRAAVLAARPGLEAALGSLAGRITTPEMRAMVAEVVATGADPFAVAARFLAPGAEAPPPGPGRRAVTLAVGALDARAGQAADIALALRKAFPERRLVVERTTDPLAQVLAGGARYALVSGPELFAPEPPGRTRPRGAADALVPVGFDMLHLLVRPGAEPLAWEGGARLGVGAADGGTARTAALVAAGVAGVEVELVPVAEAGAAGLEAQARAVGDGALDGLLVMAEAGHPRIADLLAGGLELAPIAIWEARGNRVAFPFLVPVTLPADTYEGQADPLATVGSQAVLAAARPDLGEAVGVVGPGSAAIGKTLPVGARTVARIREALGQGERLDPSLPVASAARRPPPEPPQRLSSPIGSLVNLAVILALAAILHLYLRKGDGGIKL